MSIKTTLKKILKGELAINILAFLIYVYSHIVALTTRWKIINPETCDFVIKNNVIIVGWHARAFMMPYFWRHHTDKELFALASPHQDGQIIAHLLKFFKIGVVSGSTNERAAQSALNIMHLLANKKDVFISPDGPRGPRMRMKKSPIYFASKSGLPVVFVTYSTSNAFIINKAWDKTFIALPFSQGRFALSNPLYIPADINDEEIENYRKQLEDLANELNFRCDTEVNREPILPAAPQEIKIKKYLQGN